MVAGLKSAVARHQPIGLVVLTRVWFSCCSNLSAEPLGKCRLGQYLLVLVHVAVRGDRSPPSMA